MTPQHRPGAMAPASLSHLSYYLPPGIMTVDELAERTSLSPEKLNLYKEVHGLRVIHTADGETAAEMVIKAAGRLLVESGTDPLDVDAVILYHTMYLTSLEPSTLVGHIQHELGLKRAVGFSIWEQYCASIITAMRVGQSMIRAGSARQVLLVGTDCFFGSSIREIEGITLQGEAGSAVLMTGGGERNRLVALSSHTDGSLYKGVHCSPGEFERFNLIYFLSTTRTIQRTLKKARLTLDDISLIIPHNINLSSWARILSILKCDERKFFGDNIQRHGHVFGTDLVMNLSDAIAAGRLHEGEYALLVTAGMGANWGCAVIRH
jgi:3-oxoacyl-[acyl-carrier-protein] synthase III